MLTFVLISSASAKVCTRKSNSMDVNLPNLAYQHINTYADNLILNRSSIHSASSDLGAAIYSSPTSLHQRLLDLVLDEFLVAAVGRLEADINGDGNISHLRLQGYEPHLSFPTLLTEYC